MIIPINTVECIFIDFDGVLTNNKVFVGSDGEEYVECNRADGLAINVLNQLKKKIIIISSEKNKVVKQRAKKLGVECYYNIQKKDQTITLLRDKYKFNLKKSMFVGNDVNDLKAMNLCGIRVCPSDAHKAVKRRSNFVLKTEGGEGVMREILEKLFAIKIEEYF